MAAMVGVHTLIGIGEGVITALTVGAVLAVRPDLVYGARDLRPELQLHAGGGARDGPPCTLVASPRSSGWGSLWRWCWPSS